jgi:quinol monooxygenase YgiN
MAYVLVARMTAQEGEEERAAELIGRLAPASNAEPGCIQYVPHRAVDDPRTFMIYEQYIDAAAFEAHTQTEHFQALGAGELFGLMEARERNFYETID